MSTFAPNQDKNRKFIDNLSLGEIRTLNQIPEFSYKKIVKKSSKVDVIWFNERGLPHSFFEVEHSTDINNSLLKFNELQDFYSRMVIVADSKRKDEYIFKFKNSSFNDLRKNNRVSFLDYEALNKQYESLIEQQNFEFIL